MEEQELKGEKVYNDIIDEAYELSSPEQVIEEKDIKNQMIDAEIPVSDDSQNYIPTPTQSMQESQPQINNPNFDEPINAQNSAE